MGRKLLVWFALTLHLPAAATAQEGVSAFPSAGAIVVPTGSVVEPAAYTAMSAASAGDIEQVRSSGPIDLPPGGFLSPASVGAARTGEPSTTEPPSSKAPPFDPLGVHAQTTRGPRGPASSVTRPLGMGTAAAGMGGNATSQGSAAAAAVANMVTAGDLIGFSRDLGEGVQAITIINASQRWMAVYHIDAGGQIRLTSSRPLDADFTIQFNASSPLPEEIRRLQGK